MADLAATRASSSEVKSLATTIKGAQDPEIKTMSGWLTSWGAAVPQDMKGMDMSSGMPGMMSTADMTKLEKASGTMFDTMFLQMMVQHHKGAVEMATTEQSKGEYGTLSGLISYRRLTTGESGHTCPNHHPIRQCDLRRIFRQRLS